MSAALCFASGGVIASALQLEARMPSGSNDQILALAGAVAQF